MEHAIRTRSAGTVLVANPSADLYGSDRMLLEAVRGFVRLGWRTVVTCSVDGPLVEALRDAGARVHIQPSPVVRKSILTPHGLIGFVRDIVTQTPRMRRLVKEVGPDVLFANTVTIPFWSIVARISRRPIVVYVHEAEAGLSRLSRLLLTAPLRLANGVVFNSETSRRVSGSPWLENHDRVRVVPNGVTGPGTPSPARTTVDGPFRIVYVGRLSPRKGVDLVLDAVAELRESGVEASATIVGDVFPGYEWYEAELRKRALEAGLSSQIDFAGFHSVVWDHFSAADVAVVPSRLDESFGNVLIEALLSGRPVVAADQSGLREAATGFESVVLVRPDDASALAGGIRRVRAAWPRYRDRAGADADRARVLYSTDQFQTRLSDALSERIR